jgi:hypothetical protein
MTLYRINAVEAVEVLTGKVWERLEGTKEEILISELRPRLLGNDKDYHYYLTDEPGEEGDLGIDIATLQQRSHRISVEKGWWDKPDGRGLVGEEVIGEKIALIHSEVSEALEEWRKPNARIQDIYYVNGKPEGFPVELADAIIRITELAERFSVDLTQALRIKEAYNMTRPHRHGGKRA